eukprot:1542051-Amphidinium_carterae.2
MVAGFEDVKGCTSVDSSNAKGRIAMDTSDDERYKTMGTWTCIPSGLELRTYGASSRTIHSLASHPEGQESVSNGAKASGDISYNHGRI